jgi:hypothetical protein
MADSLLDDEHLYKPVMILVPLGELRALCQLAQEAGEDLQAVAEAEYPGDHPSNVRKRERDKAWAQSVIDASRTVLLHAVESGGN